jgi:hypothetical protein
MHTSFTSYCRTKLIISLLSFIVDPFHCIDSTTSYCSFLLRSYPKLEEATTILELTLWKFKMDEVIQEEKMIQNQRKMKADESSY